MTSDSRQRLASAQAHLVRALVARDSIPPGFDEGRLRVLARSLVQKRRQSLARVWPGLVDAVGSFVERFTSYALAHPLPACANTLVDGRAFLAWLAERQELGDAGRLETLAFDLRFIVTPRGLRKRRFALKMARLRELPGLAIAVRLPWLGEWWWRFGFG